MLCFSSFQTENVTTHVKDAIKKEKLKNEYKRHQVDISSKTRSRQKASSMACRYRVVACRRAQAIDALDEANAESEQQEKNTKTLDKDESVEHDVTKSCNDPPKKTDNNGNGDHHEAKATDKVFCLFDFEDEVNSTAENVSLVL